jgi:hypothetical protein
MIGALKNGGRPGAMVLVCLFMNLHCGNGT